MSTLAPCRASSWNWLTAAAGGAGSGPFVGVGPSGELAPANRSLVRCSARASDPQQQCCGPDIAARAGLPWQRRLEAALFQTRIHGRGGQGVVTAAELLAVAAFYDGQHAQAFPSFGSERTGAPVVAYCRIDEVPIRSREPVVVPDALIVQDVTLLRQVDVFSGLPGEGYVLVNTEKSLAEIGLAEFVAEHRADRVVTLPATEVALRHLGRPLPNAVLLGGFAALTGRVSIDGVAQALGERFSGAVRDGNRAGAKEAFDMVSKHREGLTDAVAD